MPTGYTTNVVNGKITELKGFILECSKAFVREEYNPIDDIDQYSTTIRNLEKELRLKLLYII